MIVFEFSNGYHCAVGLFNPSPQRRQHPQPDLCFFSCRKQIMFMSSSRQVVKSKADNVHVVKSSSRQVVKSSSRQVVKSSSRQVVKSSSRQVVKSSSRQVVKSSSRQVVKSSNRQVVKSSNRAFDVSYACVNARQRCSNGKQYFVSSWYVNPLVYILCLKRLALGKGCIVGGSRR